MDGGRDFRTAMCGRGIHLIYNKVLKLRGSQFNQIVPMGVTVMLNVLRRYEAYYNTFWFDDAYGTPHLLGAILLTNNFIGDYKTVISIMSTNNSLKTTVATYQMS